MIWLLLMAMIIVGAVIMNLGKRDDTVFIIGVVIAFTSLVGMVNFFALEDALEEHCPVPVVEEVEG